MNNNKFKRIISIVLVLVMMFAITGCIRKSEAEVNTDTSKDELVNESVDQNDGYVPKEGWPIVEIKIQDGNVIMLELYPDIAPNTVNNFISLANSGYYDGLIYHRVIKDFMIQGGDPLGTGGGNPGYSIDGEFSNNGIDNNLSHTPGVISMARSRDYNSAGSQFFIVHGDASFLDGDYAGFGKVIYGFKEVDRIAKVDTKNDKPEEDVVMESISVDLNGYEFVEPVVNK